MKLEIFTHTERYGEPAIYGFEFLVINTDTGWTNANFTLGTFKTREEAERFVKQMKAMPKLAHRRRVKKD